MNSFHCFDAPVLSPIKSLRRVGIGMFSFLKAVHGKWIWKDCIRINNYNKSVHAGTHTHTDTFTHTAGSALDKHWDNGVMAAAISKGAQLHFVKYRISTKNTFMITQKFRINRYLSVSEKGRKQNSKSLHMWQGEKHGNLPYAKASRQNSKLAKAFDTVPTFQTNSFAHFGILLAPALTLVCSSSPHVSYTRAKLSVFSQHMSKKLTAYKTNESSCYLPVPPY